MGKLGNFSTFFHILYVPAKVIVLSETRNLFFKIHFLKNYNASRFNNFNCFADNFNNFQTTSQLTFLSRSKMLEVAEQIFCNTRRFHDELFCFPWN